MPSLVESTGAALQWLFVPADVLEAQAENQKRLEKKAEQLNADTPGTLARASKTGVMSNGAARQSLQSMNSSLFLFRQSDRELGAEAAQIVKESAANAPAVLADTVNAGINKVGGTVWRAIPWWVWAIVGVYLSIQLLTFIKLLKTR